MEKFVVVSWPESQDLMGKPGFRENSYLVNDDKGMEDFGSSAYFVKEDWLNGVSVSVTEKARTVDSVVENWLHIMEDDTTAELERPVTLSDGWEARGVYQDDGNEDIRVMCFDSKGNQEDFFLSSMPIDDAYVIAKMIEDDEIIYKEED